MFGVKENKEAGKAETDNFTEEEAELFKKYESLIVENCGLVFYNMPEDGRKRIVEYVKTGRSSFRLRIPLPLWRGMTPVLRL